MCTCSGSAAAGRGVTRKAFALAMTKMNMNASSAAINSLYRDLDPNNDGTVSVGTQMDDVRVEQVDIFTHQCTCVLQTVAGGFQRVHQHHDGIEGWLH